MQILVVFLATYLFLIIGACTAAYWLTLPREQKFRFLLFFAVAGVVAFALTKLAGICYMDPRPFVLHHFTPLIPHDPDNGFPSDHTVLSLLAALTIFRYSKTVGGVLIVLALLVGVTRVLVGVHAPIDIAGAVVIAVLATLCAAFVMKWILPAPTARKEKPLPGPTVTG